MGAIARPWLCEYNDNNNEQIKEKKRVRQTIYFPLFHLARALLILILQRQDVVDDSPQNTRGLLAGWKEQKRAMIIMTSICVSLRFSASPAQKFVGSEIWVHIYCTY